MTGPTGYTGPQGAASFVTGPTGYTGPAGADSSVTGPTGPVANTFTIKNITGSSYTILNTDKIVAVSYSGGSVALTMPTATSSFTTSTLDIIDQGGFSRANPITVTTQTGEYINGQSSLLINVNYMSVTLYSNGGTGPTNGYFII